MTFLVDGSNAVRRGGYDPRFPEVEQRRALRWLSRLDRLASDAANAQVEVFFDGPPRDVGGPYPGLLVRFPLEGSADDMIVDSTRLVVHHGKSPVVATEDGGLAVRAEHEGAQVVGFGELEARLERRSGRRSRRRWA